MSAHFESRKWAYRQTKEGTVISFLVHPNDISTEMATAPLGTRYMVAFAQIGDDEQPTEQPKAERPKQHFNQMHYAEQAGILCADPQFQKWLGEPGVDATADYVRRYCGVESRAHIQRSTEAIMKWRELVARYRHATGQMAEMRP
jgi:hypothetical protein